MSESKDDNDRIKEIEERLERLESQIEELKKQNRIVANALLDHIHGKLTVEDIKMCYEKIAEIKKYLSVVPSTMSGGSSLESILAQKLMEVREGGGKKNEVDFEPVDEETLKRLRDEKSERENKKDRK